VRRCAIDEDCAAQELCDQGTCVARPSSTNVLYLYYRDGSFTEIFGLYWAKKSPVGYRIFAPFYWHFEDAPAKTSTTVIVPVLPISWSRGPDEHSFGIWPLVYKSSKRGWAVPVLGSFTAKNPEAGSSFGAVAFLYWWKRHQEKDGPAGWDFGFPFFFAKHDPAGAFGYALPLNFYWRNGEDKNLLALPLFYWNKNKDDRGLYSLIGYRAKEGSAYGGSLFWLYWFGGDKKDDSRYDVAPPLFWSFRQGADEATVLAPIYWDFKSAKSRTIVALPFIYTRDDTDTVWSIFPLLWGGRDPRKGSAFVTLFPLFHWQKSAGGKKTFWLSPFGGGGRDLDAGTRSFVLWPAPLVYLRNPQRSFFLFTPFIAHHENKTTGAVTRLYGPFYDRRDLGGHSQVLFPLWWRYEDASTHATFNALLPFFARREGPDDTSTFVGVFPLGPYWRSFRSGGWAGGLSPFLFLSQKPDARHVVVFPVFWWTRSPGRSFTALLPLFFDHDRPDKGQGVGGIPPLLVFWGHDRRGSWAVQVPFFWRFHDEATASTTTVTPLGFFERDRAGYNLGVGPLLPLFVMGRSAERSHTVLFPLFWHLRDAREDKDTTVVLNYLHRRHGGETTDALFPLFHYRRGAKPGGADETSFTLFPFVHYSRNASRTLWATPLAAGVKTPDRSAGFAGPYLWYRDPNLAASGVPFLYLDVAHKDRGDRLRQIGPYFELTAPGRKTRALFPLWGHFKDEHEETTFVFPTFVRRHTTDGYDLTTALPFFWLSHTADSTTRVFGPFYKRTGPGRTAWGFAPFLMYANDANRTWTVMPPLLFARKVDKQNDQAWTWCALYFSKRDKTDATATLFPLWWATDRGPLHRRVLFPLYFASRDDKADTAWHLAGPAFWSSQGKAWTVSLLPLLWLRGHQPEDGAAVGLLPLFWASWGKDRRRILTPLGGYNREGPNRWFYALTYFQRDTPTQHAHLLFPLFLHWRNDDNERSRRLIPPLLHYASSDPQSTFSTWLLLSWFHENVTAKTRLFLPFYWDFTEKRLSRTTVLLPLGFRHENMLEGTTFWLAPLFYRHTTPDSGTTVAFPFVWDFKRGQDRTTVVFPFTAHWTRADHRSTWVFPSIYYRKGLTPTGAADGTSHLVVFPFYEHEVKRPGDSLWELLAGLVGQERIGQHHFMKLFFIRFETKKPAAAQTAWFGARPAVQQARKGLDPTIW